MGERGPKPSIVQRLTPAQRVELDEAIIDGRRTKADLYEQYGELAGISYSAFCNYASQLEARAKHRYVGELLNTVFGNLPDSDIDVRARGIMVVMLDKIAADVLADGELKPRDLRDIVQAYDVIRRGAIAEAQEQRRQSEWEANWMAGVAEAAARIKQELAAEISGDPELQKSLEQAVDRCCERMGQSAEQEDSVTLLKQIGRKRNWKREVWEAAKLIWGIDAESDGDASPPSGGSVRQKVRDIHHTDSAEPAGETPPGGTHSRGEVVDVIDGMARGTLTENDLDE